MENPIYKWMRTGGYPYFWKPPYDNGNVLINPVNCRVLTWNRHVSDVSCSKTRQIFEPLARAAAEAHWVGNSLDFCKTTTPSNVGFLKNEQFSRVVFPLIDHHSQKKLLSLIHNIKHPPETIVS